MPYLKLEHVNLYYEEAGEGKECLIFGHSMLFNLRMFDQQVANLKKNYRCICFDFPGHGKSSSPPDGYDLDSIALDTIALMEALDCSPCHFIGFSMGGMVALRIAIRQPELIKSLVLIDTSSEEESKGGAVRNEMMLFVAKYIGLKVLAPKVLSMFFGRNFLKNPDRKDERKEWKEHFNSNDRKGIVKAVRAVLSRKAITPEIGQIEHPTLVLVGEEDQLTDLSKAKILHSHIKNSSLKLVPRAGHMAPVEEAQVVNSFIEKHLTSVET